MQRIIIAMKCRRDRNQLSVVLFAVLAAASLAGARAAADPEPAATASPTPAAASTPAPRPTWPSKLFDPCGGPAELLVKGFPNSPCSFVLGEAVVETTYATTSIPSNTTFELTKGSFTTRGASNAFTFPNALIIVGVSPRAQISVTLPSSQVLNTSQLGSFAGATNMVFTYRDLLYFNPKGNAFGVLQLSDQVPSGSPVFAGVGPIYVVQPYINVPFGKAITLAAVLPFTNEFVSQSAGGGQRGWTFSPMLTPSWRSRGGTLIAIAFMHTFNPDTNPISINIGQLLGRNLMVKGSFGGLNYSDSYAVRYPGVIRGATTGRPRVAELYFDYLIGRSEIFNVAK
jgi:hypothetical protein